VGGKHNVEKGLVSIKRSSANQELALPLAEKGSIWNRGARGGKLTGVRADTEKRGRSIWKNKGLLK